MLRAPGSEGGVRLSRPTAFSRLWGLECFFRVQLALKKHSADYEPLLSYGVEATSRDTVTLLNDNMNGSANGAGFLLIMVAP